MPSGPSTHPQQLYDVKASTSLLCGRRRCRCQRQTRSETAQLVTPRDGPHLRRSRARANQGLDACRLQAAPRSMFRERIILPSDLEARLYLPTTKSLGTGSNGDPHAPTRPGLTRFNLRLCELGTCAVYLIVTVSCCFKRHRVPVVQSYCLLDELAFRRQ